ncbi:MAG TPA: SUF system NifU family Fe-S cluster assembly protein, partial [Nitrospina sp.]|nr:SUF system NifU family Fe-S cluster assembly protein [Nitrospina sp.]
MSYDKELYQQVILDHNRKPRNFHEIEGASHSCHGVNPLCGDDITVYLNVDEDDVIKDVSFLGSGCAISKASTSLMTTFLKGKTVDSARKIKEEFHKMILGTMDPEKDEHSLGKLT